MSGLTSTSLNISGQSVLVGGTNNTGTTVTNNLNNENRQERM